MLGTLDRSEVFAILDALAARDAKAVLERIEQLDERAPDYREVLAELAAVLQKLALLQAVSDLQLDEAEDIDTYRRLAAAISAEDIQLYYQIAIIGRRDLELAPDARAGFEMVLLRMLAFGVAAAEPAPVARPTKPAAAATAAAPRAPTPVASAEPRPVAAVSANVAANVMPTVAPAAGEISTEAAGAVKEWSQILAALNLQGPARQLAAHCAWVGRQAGRVQLRLDVLGEPFRRPGPEEKLVQALSAYFGEPIKLEIQTGAALHDTPARQHQAAAEDRMQAARTAIDNDPNVTALRDMFGATVQPESIRPLS
jgi:DNA polymerase-3 subunit gamma/tau